MATISGFIILLLAACSFPLGNVAQNNLDQNQIYTAAAQTIETTLTIGALFANLNQTITPAVPVGSETPGIAPTIAITEQPTKTPYPSNTPEPPATNTPSVPVIRATTNTNCRSGPGYVYDILGALLIGDIVEVRGRISDNSWWYIQNPDDAGKYCWVWKQTTVVDGNITSLPVLTPAPTPTPDIALITVNSSAAPLHYTGACPVNIALIGSITTSKPVTVKYQWAANFAYPFTEKEFKFVNAGSQGFNEVMVIGTTTVGYVRFRASSPYEVKDDRIDLVINCVP